MSWTDKIATKNILRLKDEFDIKVAVVTGVCKGGDAELYGHYFETVFAVDIDKSSLDIAKKRMDYLPNVHLFNEKSADFLKYKRRILACQGTVLFYLDAHFFDPKLKQKWVVVDELKALQDYKNCVIIIHDYDNGLGHLIYDGEPMGWNVVGEYIQKVNPHFHYYTNDKCDIYNEQTIYQSPLHVDEHLLDGLRYANTSDVKKYRGILYAVPCKLDLRKFQLKEGYG